MNPIEKLLRSLSADTDWSDENFEHLSDQAVDDIAKEIGLNLEAFLSNAESDIASFMNSPGMILPAPARNASLTVDR